MVAQATWRRSGAWLIFRALAFAVLALEAAPGRAAGPVPFTVTRVRVPEGSVGAAFPAGSELRALTVAEFDALVAAAQTNLQAANEADQAHLIRARHQATWRDGRLHGESELLINGPSVEAGPLRLVPWTPAIPSPQTQPVGASLRSQADGQSALWVAPGGPRWESLAWELLPRPGSDGTSFSLGLPRCDVSTLVLDLPIGLTPEGPPGIREGPGPAPGEGLRRWKFHGPTGTGVIPLRLRPPVSAATPRLWVDGSTRVEVDAAATWRADWIVTVEPGGPRRLTVELDPGLEPLGVEGPGVVAYAEEPSRTPETVCLSIRLADEVEGPTPLTIRAAARVPGAGVWTVPAARPLDAVWTGGRTFVRVGPERIVETCRERAGVAVALRPDEVESLTGAGEWLAFAARAPRAVAELTFRRPGLDAAVTVRGTLIIGPGSARFDAALDWRIERGRALTLRVDLPGPWEADEVALAGASTPIAWQAEPRDQGSRLVVHVPPSLDDGAPRSLRMSVAARVANLGRDGLLTLPRVVPVEGRIADEQWSAWLLAPDLTLRPVEAQGLAWMFPNSADVTPPEGAVTGLSWRWISATGRATLQIARGQPAPTAEVVELATLDADRLSVDLQVVLDVDQTPLETLPILLDGPTDLVPEWRLADAGGGTPIPARPLDEAARVAAGLPAAGGTAWRLELPTSRQSGGALTLRARVEGAWDGQGAIPLVRLPESVRRRGRVLVAVERSLRSTAEATGLLRLEASVALAMPPLGTGIVPGAPGSRHRLAHAFAFAPGERERLDVRTETLQVADTGGVIREALLSAPATALGRAPQRLTLQIVSTGARALELELPPGAALQRVRVDGETVKPGRHGRAISVAIPASSPTRPLCTVVVEYAAPQGTGGSPLRPPRPTFSLPCLSFTWELSAPREVATMAAGAAVVATEPAADDLWSGWRMDPALLPWTGRDSSEPPAGLFAELAQRIPQSGREGIPLGDLLLRWDAGERPILIDRLALAAAGWGPRTRLIVPEASEAEAPLAWLRATGLALEPIGGVLLVTTRDQLPASSPGSSRKIAWQRVLRESAGLGSDPTDRFQTVARWRSEDSNEGHLGLESSSTIGGRPARWYEAIGWPSRGIAVSLVNQAALSAWAWAAGLGVLSLGIAARRQPAGTRSWAMALLTAAAILGAAWGPPALAATATGAAVGALCALAFWLGQALRPRLQPVEAGHRSSVMGRARLAGPQTGAFLVLLALVPLLVGGSWGRADVSAAGAQEVGPDPAQPPVVDILAVIPHDGSGRKSGQVWILRSDDERLRDWAAHPGTNADTERNGPWALDAEHEVRPAGPKAFLVESHYELVLEAHGPASWTVPLGAGREHLVRLGDQEVPFAIRPDGSAGDVWLQEAGRHRLTVRRIVDHPAGPGSCSLLDLPVNPVATARVRLLDLPGNVEVAIRSARGSVTAADGALTGLLGPADHLEIRKAASPGPPAPQGTVEGLLLWDAEPAGDRIRARFTYHDQGDSGQVRLRLGPGLLVRSATAPGLVEWDQTTAQDGSIWVGRIDPPLTDSATLSLELWRPATTAQAADPASSSGRTLPQVEPLDTQTYSGVLGFRRPGRWSGRLSEVGGVEIVPDEQFARSWGPWPDATLTLAGAIRFAATPDRQVPTGPIAPRASVSPTVEIAIESGRLALKVEAPIAPRTGRVREVELDVPTGLRISRIVAEGLTDWSRPAANRIRLRFGGPEPAPGTIELQGWLPVEDDPMDPEPTAHDLALFWPGWIGLEPEEGQLRVSAPEGLDFQVVPAPGVEPEASIPDRGRALPRPPAGPSPAQTFRIEPAGRVGRLRWTEPGPQPRVSVHEVLTIFPEAVSLAARIRYDIVGGPLSALTLSMPTAWAEAAEIDAPGIESSRTSRVQGEQTVVTLRPDRPIWGTQQVLVRATRPFDPAEGLVFPDLVPHGEGAIETHQLMVANATGGPLPIEGSSRIEQVVAATFATENIEPPAGAVLSAYHVLEDGWRLAVRPDPEVRPETSDGESAPIELADLHCTLGPSGASWGRARYTLRASGAAFLALGLPVGVTPLAATVDGAPTRSLRAASGDYLIPLGSVGARQVTLAWHAEPARPGPDGARPLPLPEPKQTARTTLLTVHSPQRVAVEARQAPVSPDVLEQARARNLAEQIAEGLALLDRSSPRARAELLAALIRFEIQCRVAERAVAWNLAARNPSTGYAHSTFRRTEEVQRALAETLELEGLGDFVRSARVRVGREPGPDPLSDLPEFAEPPAALRIRRLGQTTCFRSHAPARGQDLGLSWRPIGTAGFVVGRPGSSGPILAALAVLGLGLGFGLAGPAGRARRGWVLTALISLIGGLALIWLPAAAAALASFGLGRVAARS